ncbi:MAG: DUF2931 family protein [Weeksellaceae bacterium]
MKTKQTSFYFLLVLCVILCLLSCKDNNRYQWQPAISAPKYYPVAGNVDFGNAGHGSNTSFDKGWGRGYGGVVSGDIYKEIPREVYIEYYSVVDAKDFRGTVSLPYDELLQLFKKYCKNKEEDRGRLLVGMAPGGWIRVWAYFHSGTEITDNIEIAKAKLEIYDSGRKRDSVTYDHWLEYYTYWQHFGIPYEAWSENEKEYDLYFDFDNPNPDYEVFDVIYSSIDGSINLNIMNDKLMKKRKIPADLIVAWRKRNDTLRYDTHILFPKNFHKIINKQNPKQIKISLHINADDQGDIYIQLDNNKKDKFLRFKNYPAKARYTGNSDFSQEVEYFIK